MTEELETLRDVVQRLEEAKMDYMLTGSVALNCYAQPRMTRDIDLVVAFQLEDVERIVGVLGSGYYVSTTAAREACLAQTSFNAIHQETLTKIDFMIQKKDEYRLHEFMRRVRVRVEDFELWVVSKEDLILSKLHWSKDSLSERQFSDVENLIATGCDVAYLEQWSVKLNLTDMLTRVLP